MATSAQMIAAGLAFLVNTVVLIVSAFFGDKVFSPIFAWENSFQYSKAPPLDPGMMSWIPGLYFGLLIVMWFALLAALIIMVMNRETYAYPQGGF